MVVAVPKNQTIVSGILDRNDAAPYNLVVVGVLNFNGSDENYVDAS